MFISDFAIRRPIVTVTAMVALVVFGIFALLNLHTDEFPDIQQPVVGVTIVYPGASPSEVTREIIDPVEDAIFGISGVDGEKSTCSATDGLASCTIFFEFEKPIVEIVPEYTAVGEQVLLLDDIDHGEPDRTRDRITTKRRECQTRELVRDLGRRDRPSDRHTITHALC